jgi:hypothetical protein
MTIDDRGLPITDTVLSDINALVVIVVPGNYAKY